jgi:hypothetical protein
MSLLDLNLPPSDSGVSPATAAIKLLKFGYTPIPTLPGKKFSPVTWNAWSADLDEAKIQQYYASHPDHEVACLTNDELIVFDADSEASLQALQSIEQKHGIRPMLIVKTPRGFHHHFRRAGAIATQDAHDSTQHPDRIDIRTGRSMIVMPPSGGRSVLMCEATCLEDLSIATQEFIDDIFIHNGRQAPSAVIDEPDEETRSYRRITLAQLAKLVHLLDADMGYQDWLNVGMAVFHETGGSSEGLSLFDNWSSGSKKYGGTKEIEVKWNSFKGHCSNPITVGTLVMLAKRYASETEVHSALADDFEPCAYEVVEPQKLASPSKAVSTTATPFLRFSLTGKLEEIEKNVANSVYVLNGIALLGETTVIYAPPNSGKTLITLALLADGIKKGRIDPDQVYYLNMDDSARGLAEKATIAEEFGFHMVAQRYLGFTIEQFEDLIIECLEQKCARGMIVILDTLKKFADLMSKTESSQFGSLCREFAQQGGTIIALAHTNKNRSANGTLVPGGTSDVIDDVDCSYVIDTLPSDSSGTAIVEFANIKCRGIVTEKMKIRYARSSTTISYRDMFDSVETLDEETAAKIEVKAQRQLDEQIIAVISFALSEKAKNKGELIKAAVQDTGESRGRVIEVIERYTGTNPKQHIWQLSKQARGAHVFRLLNSEPGEDIVAI